MEEHLRVLITEDAMKRRQETLKRLKAFQDQMRKKYGVLSDSAPGIREDRQARG